MPEPQWCIGPAVRLWPPPNRASNSQWLARDLTRSDAWLLSDLAAAVLMGFLVPTPWAERIERIVASTGAEENRVNSIARSLRDSSLVVVDGLETNRIRIAAAQWSARGWAAAFDHHLVTRAGAPPLPRDPTSETRAYSGPTAAPQGLAQLNRPSNGAWRSLLTSTDRFVQSSTDRSASTVVQIIAAAMDAIPELAISRSPIRVYLVTEGLHGLDRGVFRYDIQSRLVVRVADLPSADTLRRMLEGPRRATFPPAGFLILSAVWERCKNERGERWPFQSAFIRAGRLANAIEFVSHARGIPVSFHHGVDDRAWQMLLGVDPSGLEEGVICGAAIARAGTRRGLRGQQRVPTG